MDIRNWVPPVEGEVNDLFDILLWSVGGGTEEGYEHLRQCLLWKYMHPADFMLPSPVLYGEGGVGKNFLIDGVLKTLFAGQSTSLGISQVLGGFNGLMAGKSVVMVNEAAGDRVDYEKVKEIVHSPTLTINEKYGGQYQADATAWVWLCCNDPAGAVRMAGNGVDRRWSPIELKHTLLHWVQERKGLREQDAKNWLLDNDWVARNRDEVGKWVNSLIAKGLPERRPEPLHTAGYADLTDSQKGPLEDLVDIIDGHADVQYLMGDLVYEAYLQLQKRTNPSGRPLGRNKFYKTLEVYLEKQWKGRWKLVRTDVYSGRGPKATKTKQKVMFRVGVEERMYSDMSKYVDCVQNVLLVQSSFAPRYGSAD
jgi:phage/plasmid-associated DNA primase